LLKVDVDAQAVKEAFESVTTDLQRSVKLPGFRPGKVPKDIITKNFSKDLEAEVRRRIINDAYKKAIADQKLHPVSSPNVKEGNLHREQNFTFDITIETAPDFELPEYKGLPVKKEIRTVTDADMERALNVLRERVAQYNDVDRPAREGDIVVVNYTGTSEGRPLTDFAPTARGLTQQQNFWMEIKPGHFVPGFTEQLTGANKGEKRTVTVTFPQEFVAPQLSGKEGVYEVEIVQVKEKNLPEMNDEFAKQWGAEGIDKLREGVRKDLENEIESTTRRNIRSQLIQGLSERVQCELPESLVQGETRSAIYNIVAENNPARREQRNHRPEKRRDLQLRHQHRQRKTQSRVPPRPRRRKGNIQVSREELMARIIQIAQEREMKPEKLIKDLQKSNGFGGIHEQLLLSKAVDFLEKHATVEEVQPTPAAPAS
jgi:trigger factor